MTYKFAFLCSFLWLTTLLANTETPIPDSNNYQERFIEVDDAKLFCRTIGKGSPIILLHGGPGLTQDYLQPQMNVLAKDHLLIFYDQRGSGKSSEVEGCDSINIETYVKDLDDVRKAFGIDKVTLLGHSWGGFLAMQYALAHPDQVNKLILSNSLPPSADEIELFVRNWVKRMTPFQAKLKEVEKTQKYKDGDPDTIEQYFRILFSGYCYDPKMSNQLSLQMSTSAWFKYLNVQNCFRNTIFSRRFDYRPMLEKLNVPTLIIHGQEDIIPISTAQNLHKTIKESKFVELKECGHFPYVETPDIYFQNLNEFLREHSKVRD